MRLAKVDWNVKNKVNFNLFNLFGVPEAFTNHIARYGKPKSCRTGKNTLMVAFTAPRADSLAVVMQANPLTYYNVKEANVCEMEYKGPTFALVNGSSGCYKEVRQADIQSDQTVLLTCLNTHQSDVAQMWCGPPKNAQRSTGRKSDETCSRW